MWIASIAPLGVRLIKTTEHQNSIMRDLPADFFCFHSSWHMDINTQLQSQERTERTIWCNNMYMQNLLWNEMHSSVCNVQFLCKKIHTFNTISVLCLLIQFLYKTILDISVVHMCTFAHFFVFSLPSWVWQQVGSVERWFFLSFVNKTTW